MSSFSGNGMKKQPPQVIKTANRFSGEIATHIHGAHASSEGDGGW